MLLSAKLKKLLDTKLTTDEKNLLKSLKNTVEFESRKDSVVMRMPAGVIMLDSLWEKIHLVCVEHKIPITKAPTYATAEELDNVLGDIQWLWKHWIPRGLLTMIAADPGMGKTYLAIDFVRMAIEGLPFPGNMESLLPGKHKAVWVDAENGQQILRERLIAMSVNKRSIYIPVIDGDILCKPDFQNEDHKEYIRGMVESTKPVIMVLDALGGSHNGGENKVEEMRPIMDFLAGLAQEFNIAIIVLHHLNKGAIGESTEVSLYRIRGSSVITAMCRSIISIESGSKDGENKIRIVKSNITNKSRQPELSVKATLDDDENISEFFYSVYAAPAEKTTKKQKCVDWILGVLKASPNNTALLHDIVEFGASLGYARNTIYEAKKVIGDKITVGGTGNKAIWTLTEAVSNPSETTNDLDSFSQILKLERVANDKNTA